MTNERAVQKYSKDDLIRNIAQTSGMNILVVKIVIETLEKVITSMLQSANSDKDVSIKLFNGFYFDSVYMPNKQQKNNFTGKLIDVASKIKVKTRVTRGYTEKLNR